MTISDIWCEKYRPSTLNDIVLNKTTRNYFNKVQQEKTIPNVLFVGISLSTPNFSSILVDFRCPMAFENVFLFLLIDKTTLC